MASVHAFIYALRGWLAFVAFMDIGTAIRCYLDADFLTNKVYNVDYAQQASIHPAMARLFGMWSILNAVVVLHCALCIHHAPILVMTLCSLVLSIVIYVIEAFIYETVTVSMAVIFPIAVNGLTIVLLGFAPHYLWSPEILSQDLDEEEEILKKGFPTRKLRHKKRK